MRNDIEIIEFFAGLSANQADWQRTIGFGEEGDALRKKAKNTASLKDSMSEEAAAALRNYYIAKLALITTEVTEAIEEIRHNHAITETYYLNTEPEDNPKPEGVPSELADVVIRCLSLAGEIGLDLGAIIVEKLAYNETRAQKHGGKAI